MATWEGDQHCLVYYSLNCYDANSKILLVYGILILSRTSVVNVGLLKS